MSATSDELTEEFWQILATDFVLDRDQLAQLRAIVDDISRQIESHKVQSALAPKLSSRQRNTALRKLRNHLAKLEAEIGTFCATGHDLLTLLLSDVLAQSLSNDGIEMSLREGISWTAPNPISDHRRKLSRDEGYGDLERHYLEHRAFVAERRTSDLLAGFLRIVRQPIDDFLAVENIRNRGGRPADLYRNHTVARLFVAYPEIFGKPPKTTPEGSFMSLCETILEQLGENTRGLETAVQRAFRQHKRR